jgi:hypothetical protein
VETGMLDSSGILGPFSNWILAAVFTVLLYAKRKEGFTYLVLGAAAVSNAVNRMAALISFFIGAMHNTLHLADEVEWGLKSVKGLSFPMGMDKITAIADNQPALILSNPRIYIWPAISILISSACFYFAYKRLYIIYGSRLETKLSKWIFGLMPVFAGIILIFIISLLDNIVRINW